ncbi:hypothetical protein CB1_000486013 [Camelus ferus]|nr:hypothetical protein CB1_000486013 [Camelus ferus]
MSWCSLEVTKPVGGRDAKEDVISEPSEISSETQEDVISEPSEIAVCTVSLLLARSPVNCPAAPRRHLSDAWAPLRMLKPVQGLKSDVQR